MEETQSSDLSRTPLSLHPRWLHGGSRVDGLEIRTDPWDHLGGHLVPFFSLNPYPTNPHKASKQRRENKSELLETELLFLVH